MVQLLMARFSLWCRHCKAIQTLIPISHEQRVFTSKTGQGIVQTRCVIKHMMDLEHRKSIRKNHINSSIATEAHTYQIQNQSRDVKKPHKHMHSKSQLASYSFRSLPSTLERTGVSWIQFALNAGPISTLLEQIYKGMSNRSLSPISAKEDSNATWSPCKKIFH
ncbi:GGDEF domain-containing protein domain protein [Striga asiatica]|uniref:GGDEF domain-containing protein domain protein n=1 Tax=Striga asiatica TaxID=4170 RepID=A0A5A7Q3X3_STRAF|nr:GGDEF domain-containing protein domain protein [Striga asiatica]